MHVIYESTFYKNFNLHNLVNNIRNFRNNHSTVDQLIQYKIYLNIPLDLVAHRDIFSLFIAKRNGKRR